MKLIILILAILSFVFFFIYPLILIIRCLFDKEVPTGVKILTLLTTFFIFPLPSFVFGAFYKGSTLCKYLIVINIIMLVLIILGFVLGFGTGLIEGVQDNIDIDTKPQQQTNEPEEGVYKGYNTYDINDVNVFKFEK